MTERRGKFNAIRTTIDNITFASASEARRYQELKLMEGAGEIFNLQLQPKFEINVNGVHICNYIADFRYAVPDEKLPTYHIVVEDVKGVKTSTYRLKKKLVEAYGVKITEVTA